MGIYVKELWRYPVKSMAGEPLDTVELTLEGVKGDRLVLVHNGRGVVTSRTKPGLLGLKGTLRDDGVALVNGVEWTTPEALQMTQEAAGTKGVGLGYYDGLERFDILPLLVATDGTIEAFGRDRRRLRPNILLGGVEGLAEREWERRNIRIGEAVIYLHSLRDRCVMTTFDPDTQEQDVDVLIDINKRFQGKLALNAAVEKPGTISVGDAVELI